MKNKLLIILTMLAFISGCSTVDDYLLGKDNTPKPKQLKPVDSKLKVSNNWSVSVAKPIKTAEYLKLKPIIKNNIIYTADTSGLLRAVSKTDGAVKWTSQLNHGVVSGPTIADGYIAVGTNAGTLALMNQADGKLVWQQRLTSEVLSPPAIARNTVLAKTIDGKVFAFDAPSGKRIWTADHGSPNLILKASSSPVVLGHLVIVGFSDGKLDAYELNNGQLAWQRSIAYAIGASDVERLVDIDADPIVKDNIAYIASYQGYIGALSLADGQFIWRKPGSVYKNMILSKNSLYLTDSNDVVWSLDKTNGHVNWKQTALKARGLTEPVLYGSKLLVADKTGYMHVLNLQTGEILAHSQLASGVTIAPSVAGKNVYVLTDNGMLNQISVS